MEVVIAYAFLTMALTYPGPLKLMSVFMCGKDDGFVFVWNLWWVKEALVTHHVSPFFTHLLWYPHGTPLYLHPLSVINCLLSVPLQLVFGLPAAYNVIILHTFFVAALGAFWLSYEITRSRSGAFLAGIVYAFSPYHFSVAQCQINTASIHWLPFYALFLLKVRNGGGARDSFLAGLFLVLTALSCWYYFVFALAFTILFVGYHCLSPAGDVSLRVMLRRLIPAFAVTAVILGPLIARTWLEAHTGHYPKGHNSYKFSADAVSYLTPNFYSIYSPLFSDVGLRFSGGAGGNGAWPGMAVLALSGLAVWKRPKAAGFWTLSLIVFLSLSLGPVLKIMNTSSLPIFLPYRWVERLVPGMDMTGNPMRFALMVFFSLSVLVGIGASHIADKVPSSRRSGLVTLSLAMIISLSYLPRPFTQESPSVVPDSIREVLAIVRADSREGAILNCPSEAYSSMPMYLQTIHCKPIIAEGYLARPRLDLRNGLAASPNVEALTKNDLRNVRIDRRQLLAELGARRILYLVTLTRDHRRLIEDQVGMNPLCTAGEMAVYEVEMGKEKISD